MTCLLKYLGEFEKLSGIQRRKGNVAKTPKGTFWYNGKRWSRLIVKTIIDDKEFKEDDIQKKNEEGV